MRAKREGARRQAVHLEHMVALFAHEFRNSLQPIRSGVALALDELGESQERAREHLERVQTALDRARELTGRLGAYAGPAPSRLERVDLGGMIEELRQMAISWKDPSLRVRTDVARDLPPLPCDAVQLRQALLNLVLNARDAMPEGGVLTLGCRSLAHTIEIYVADTGTGIAPEHRGRIFEPFFSTKAGGTGLGLRIARDIIEGHGGHVLVHSASGEGTSIRLRLPLSGARRRATGWAGT